MANTLLILFCVLKLASSGKLATTFPNNKLLKISFLKDVFACVNMWDAKSTDTDICTGKLKKNF
jgi:hypothetical protein